jgi:hypothetical protein
MFYGFARVHDIDQCPAGDKHGAKHRSDGRFLIEQQPAEKNFLFWKPWHHGSSF